jgi:hypothetical protein
VVPHLAHGGGDGWNSNGMASMIFRREHDRSLGHRCAWVQAVAGDDKRYGVSSVPVCSILDTFEIRTLRNSN